MTQQKSLFEQIEQELRNSWDTLERLQQENKNPSLETDLLREQVVRLYEHVVKLQKELATPSEGPMTDEDQAHKQMQSFAELHQQYLEYKQSKDPAPEEELTEDSTSPIQKESGEPSDPAQTVETTTNPPQTAANHSEPNQNEEAFTSNEEPNSEEQPEADGAVENEEMQEETHEPESKHAPAEDPAGKEQSVNANQSSKEGESGQSLLDKFKASSKASLHERFQEKNQQRVLSDRLKQTPISDLKSAIPVNQRIAFVQNLFNGDQKVYKKTVDFVDKCKNYSEAKMYIQSKIKDKYDWTDEDGYVQEFMNYVYRKFLS